VPINLDPPEALTAFPHELLKGKFIRIPADAEESSLTGNIIEFQYNPESITRTRTGQWEARNRRRRGRRASSQSVRGRSAEGSAALLADSETISMKIVFDATEAMLAGTTTNGNPEEDGISAHLAALALIPMGKSSDPRGSRRDSIRPVRPDQLLLVLGERYYPVVITSLTITEKKFTPRLAPIRAEVDLKMNVLEATESAYNIWIRRAFDYLVREREAKAANAYADSDETLSAIEGALNQD
jgi:hypothetical protein